MAALKVSTILGKDIFMEY